MSCLRSSLATQNYRLSCYRSGDILSNEKLTDFKFLIFLCYQL